MERLSLDRWASPWLRHQHIARYLWASNWVRGRRVLDAACGSGYGSRILLAGGAGRVDGVDNSEEAIEEATRAGRMPGLHFLAGDASRLPLRDETYEVYVCFETIEHVEDDKKLVDETVRILTPGGTFFCSTPNRSLVSPGRSLSDRPVNPFHMREYCLEELASLLGSSFCSMEFIGQTVYPRWYAEWLRAMGRWSPALALRLHQLRKIASVPWWRLDTHRPRQVGPNEEAEVIIAVCRK